MIDVHEYYTCINKDLKVSSRGNKTSVELLTGLVPKDDVVWLGVDAEMKELSNEEVLAEMPALHDALEGLWQRAVASQQSRRRSHAKGNRGVIPAINIGDYVLVAMKVSRTKLSMMWTGPHEVIDTVNPFTFSTRPLGAQATRKPHLDHTVRIKRFSNAELGTEADMKRLLEAAQGDFPLNYIKRITAHRVTDKGAFELKVRWLGWPGAPRETPGRRFTTCQRMPHTTWRNTCARTTTTRRARDTSKNTSPPRGRQKLWGRFCDDLLHNFGSASAANYNSSSGPQLRRQCVLGAASAARQY